MHNGSRLAAVDLGSNSFRLEIGRIEHGQFYRTEYLKETVRLGNGLDENRNLTPEALQRGWDCLARFGERLAGFAPEEVRAVATQTLREARNRQEFLGPGARLLGFPIDVISGHEEARLIYQGVAQGLPRSDETRLVIDIGGRSTELILGQGLVPQAMESYRLGSVAWSLRYFSDGLFTKRSFQTAEVAAQALLDEALAVFPKGTWHIAYGSAGTVNAVADVLQANGWPAGAISREALDWLLEKLLLAQSAERLRLSGMREDRKAIIGGGLSILRALFDLLNIDQLVQVSGGLRHGLIADMLGRDTQHLDLRTHSVQRLAAKFQADPVHGQRVGRVAVALFDQLAGAKADWVGDDRHRRKLGWAAQLLEIGSQISHEDYHKHSAYILENTDAMGFNWSELHRLGLLVLGHRGKLRKLDADLEDPIFVSQLLSLRLAVALCHARRDPDLEGLQLEWAPRTPKQWVLSASEAWAQTYPQSAYLLQEEAAAWQKTPWTLFIQRGEG
jgi:exopolyphosphatase/guanosine-5'-triphosphate,3'-diphosphate pyrophosphatase